MVLWLPSTFLLLAQCQPLFLGLLRAFRKQNLWNYLEIKLVFDKSFSKEFFLLGETVYLEEEPRGMDVLIEYFGEVIKERDCVP